MTNKFYSRAKVLDIGAHFWSKVDIKGPDECWPWKGSCKPNGYGQFAVNRKPIYAHRFAFEQAYGPVPEGMHVCHKCDNPPCCNWSHLFAGTAAENIADKVSKGRQGKGRKKSPEVILINSLSHKGQIPWNKGKRMSPEFGKKVSIARQGLKLQITEEGFRKTAISNAKLSIRDVQEIKRMILDGAKNIDLARRFEVDRSIISRIRTGKAWWWVETNQPPDVLFPVRSTRVKEAW